MIKRITCKLKGHLWALGNFSTTPDPQKGSYWVHNVCLRCGEYRKELRQSVPFRYKEQEQQ